MDVGKKMEMLAVEPTEKYYPRLNLDLKDFPEFKEIGQKVSIVAEGKIVGLHENDDGGSIEIEIHDCEPCEEKTIADTAYKTMTGSRNRY